MSPRARTLNSSAERRWMALSSRRTSVGVPRKSKRCPTSRRVWLIALSTSCRSTRHTTSTDGIGPASIGGRTDDVNPRWGREAKQLRLEGNVAPLVGEDDAGRRPERVGDAGLLDGGVRLAHGEQERANGRVAAGHESQHPAVALVALEAGREVALDAAEPA